MVRPDRRTRRRASAARWDAFPAEALAPQLHYDETTGTALHDERLDAVVRHLVASGAGSVLDLGCGSGALLRRLVAEPRFTRIVGVDLSGESILAAERSLAPLCPVDGRRLSLVHGSFTVAEAALAGFDAAAMVETIEHVEPAHLSRVEHAVFAELRPGTVLVTTPNREYNVMFGLADGEFRHPDHRFEWTRSRFASWAGGVAGRNGYHATLVEIGPSHPLLGSPTQMAVFQRDQNTAK